MQKEPNLYQNIEMSLQKYWEEAYEIVGERYVRLMIKKIANNEPIFLKEIDGGHNTVITEYAAIVISLVSLAFQWKEYLKNNKKKEEHDLRKDIQIFILEKEEDLIKFEIDKNKFENYLIDQTRVNEENF